MDIMISDLFKIYKNMCRDKDVFCEYFYDRHDIYDSVTMNNEEIVYLEEKNQNIIIDFSNIRLSNSYLCYDDKKILKYYNECCRQYEKDIIEYFECEPSYDYWENYFLDLFFDCDFAPESVYNEKFEIDYYPMFIRHTFVENLWKKHYSEKLVEKRRKRIRCYRLKTSYYLDPSRIYEMYKNDCFDFFIGV
jgi:hypothetical protein